MKRAFLFSFIAFMTTLFGPPLAAQSVGNKIALVIGVGNYKSLPQLSNPVRDAETVAATLSAAGFKVDLLTDAPVADIDRALVLHQKLLADLPATGISLVYFAGHGFDAGGIDLIAGMDATSVLSGASPVGYMALSRFARLADHSKAGATSLVVIDACRKLVELKGMDLAINGLNQTTLSDNTAILYSTGQFQSAADGGEGELSPFASAFIAEMQAKSQPWPLFTANVAKNVSHSTVPAQRPEIRSRSVFVGALNDQPVEIGEALFYRAMQNANTVGREKWIANLSEVAKKYNNVNSMLQAGYSYMSTPQNASNYAENIKVAEDWFKLAAQRKSGEGWHRIGELREKAGDIAGAITAYKTGSSLGNSESNYHLGSIYGSDNSPYRDVPQAIKYYEANLTAANCCSAVNLGLIYYEGKNGRVDKAKAQKLFQLAADRGNVKGWANLARIYLEQNRVDDAISALRHGEAARDPWSLHKLGNIHHTVQGYVDYAKVVKYYREAEDASIAQGESQKNIDYYRYWRKEIESKKIP